MDLEGRILGNRYEMMQKIGNGGMATVYKAKDTILKRYVAVKVLRDEFTTDEEFIRRFNTEAQAAASLTHPNIVSIYDVGKEDNVYYIVMELIQGKTLKQIIEEDGALPWKWSLNIAIQIASALETAHKNNIVHRDIKPHNIIITEEGIAKVTDFGIAKAVSNSTITAFGTTIGSVHYFSPEHARGGFTDAKSDLYSLGVVMYEMLTGKVPFDADTPVSIALKHMQEKPVDPMKLNPVIPYAVNKIILKAMEKDLNLRYQSATEMLKDLSMALKNPEGNFVRDGSNETAYTQVIPTLDEEEIITDKKVENRNGNKTKVGKFKKYLQEHPAVKIGLIVALVILIPLIVFLATQGILNIGRAKDVALPNFVGMTREEAEQVATDNNLVLEIEEQFNQDVELGKVISQDPGFMENYQIKEKSTVKLVVSKGVDIKVVPKVTGKTFEEAQAEIEGLELVIEKAEESSETVEAGIIIRQDPEAETELNSGETVTVYVSTGIKQISMEHVIGQKESSAKKILTKAGFDVSVVYEEDTTKEDGVVIKQSIDAGSTVKDGTKVTITVNKIEQLKQGTVKVNLQSLTGGIEKDEEGTEIDPTALVEITVTSEGNEETVYKENQRKDTKNITTQVTGKGTVIIKVFINEVKKVEKQLNLNASNPTLTID